MSHVATSRETQAIAEILRGELGKANRNTTWFGNVMRDAEGMSGDDGWTPVNSSKIG